MMPTVIGVQEHVLCLCHTPGSGKSIARLLVIRAPSFVIGFNVAFVLLVLRGLHGKTLRRPSLRAVEFLTMTAVLGVPEDDIESS